MIDKKDYDKMKVFIQENNNKDLELFADNTVQKFKNDNSFGCYDNMFGYYDLFLEGMDLSYQYKNKKSHDIFCNWMPYKTINNIYLDAIKHNDMDKLRFLIPDRYYQKMNSLVLLDCVRIGNIEAFEFLLKHSNKRQINSTLENIKEENPIAVIAMDKILNHSEVSILSKQLLMQKSYINDWIEIIKKFDDKDIDLQQCISGAARSDSYNAIDYFFNKMGDREIKLFSSNPENILFLNPLEKVTGELTKGQKYLLMKLMSYSEKAVISGGINKTKNKERLRKKI